MTVSLRVRAIHAILLPAREKWIIEGRSRSVTIAPGIVVAEAGIAEICHRYKVKELAVFGSAARGELRPDSDIDLLVEFLPEAEVDLVQHSAAERELSAFLGRKVDLVSKRALRSALQKEILSQARVVYAT